VKTSRSHALTVYRIATDPATRETQPPAIRAVLPPTKSGQWLVSFISPTPDGAEYLGRNHRFVATLAQFLMEEALTKGGAARASRCGAIRTRAVSRLTALYLLRLRFLIEQPDRTPLLAEEVQVLGRWGRLGEREKVRRGEGSDGAWLGEADVLQLLADAQADENIIMEERHELDYRRLDRLRGTGLRH